MPFKKPFRRIFRPQTHREATRIVVYGSEFLTDTRYVSDATDFIRSYRLLEKDLVATFDYVEPVSANAHTYSHRFYQLLTRACMEFEANAKAILLANGYAEKKPTIKDYWKLEAACRLSEYRIKNPVEDGPNRTYKPFSAWNGTSTYTPLPWYQDYNDVKHNRSGHFENASLSNVLNAVSAVLVVLFAQFSTLAFHPYYVVMYQGQGATTDLSHEDSFFQISLPEWPHHELYEFVWERLKDEADPFENYPFPP